MLGIYRVCICVLHACIISRLIQTTSIILCSPGCLPQDHVLLPLMVEEEEGEMKDDPLLVVHPNYVVET